MHGELPTFKRCCCCLPLRYGLLFWGYFKLAFAVALAYPVTRGLVLCIAYGVDTVLWIMLLLSFIFTYAEIVLNILFIVAAHKKSFKLINVCCYYMMVSVVVIIILWIIMLVNHIIQLSTYGAPFYAYWYTVALSMSLVFLYIVVHGYVILLTRSEVSKLRDNCQFNFTNVGAEAECALSLRTHTHDHASTQPI